MIEFANKHKIYPTCEEFEFENFKGAYDKLLNGRPKYRCVVKVGNAPETLKKWEYSYIKNHILSI